MTAPNFLIIGVAKAGTTSLHKYLEEHPEVFVSELKELNFFAYQDPFVASNWEHLPFPAKTWEDYLRHFENAGSHVAIGEASPIYFESPLAPQRIRERLDDVRLIVSLRDPRERAFSGYLMHVREGLKPMGIDEFVDPEARFVRGGFYYEKLRRYFDVFGSSRIHVVLFDEIRNEPQRVMHGIYRFLELNDTEFCAEVGRRHNVGSYPRLHWLNSILTHRWVRDNLASITPRSVRQAGKKVLERNRGAPPRLDPALRARLNEMYREDVLRVQDLIGRDLSSWLG